jgi:tetratricopeptide (TPR) repeat protein
MCLFLLAILSGLSEAHGQNSSPKLDSTQILAQRAHEAALRGDWPASASLYQQAIELAPRDPDLRIGLGLAFTRSERYTDAIASYEEALRISPRNLAAELGLAQNYRNVHNYDEMRHILDRAIREHPKSAPPLSMLGDLDLEMQSYDATIQHLSAALALDPAANETRDRLASAYKSKGDVPHALLQLSRVIARDPKDALAYFLRAQIFSDQNEDARALPDAQKVVDLQPQNPRGRVLLAKVLLRATENAAPEELAARCSRAVAAIEPVVETQSNDSETLFLLARAQRCAGNSEEAQKTLTAFEDASQHDRTIKENQSQAKHLVEQANERARQNDFPDAVDLLQQSLAKDPAHGAAYSQLAKLYYSAGDIENASQAIAHALELNPYQPDFLYVEGKILQKQGKLDEALVAFERTTLVNPSESDAYFEMGVIYEQRNDRAHALAAYKKAVALSPDDPDYRRALATLTANSSPH